MLSLKRLLFKEQWLVKEVGVNGSGGRVRYNHD